MPFHYDLRLPEELSGCKLIDQLVLKGSYIEVNSTIGILASGNGRFLLRNAGRGVLREWFVSPGMVLKPGQSLARMDADGEDIPYGKPYLIVERE